VLRFPGKLSAQKFLAEHWQKAPLFMPGAIRSMRPVISRNELAWLATLDDVESRIVFTERSGAASRYRAESGPFEPDYLQALPKRDWTLLVHDVDKHLPTMRRLFQQVPFIPDWRIDDLMISFAAPGGGVGPHQDNYDVFLCQGIGLRDWRFTSGQVEADPSASDDLALLREFEDGESCLAQKGDVLYLPPGVPHWGTAKRACLTYSIGMRAPSFYEDPDLQQTEVRPGYISRQALNRAGSHAATLGKTVTELKQWLQPDTPDAAEIAATLATQSARRRLRLHGMTRIAYDDRNVYVNGAMRTLEEADRSPIAALCARRSLSKDNATRPGRGCLTWLLQQGAFEQAAPE